MILSTSTKISYNRLLNKNLDKSLYITNGRHENCSIHYIYNLSLLRSSLDLTLPALSVRVSYICFALLHMMQTRRFYLFYNFLYQKIFYIRVMWLTPPGSLPHSHTATTKHFYSFLHQTNVPCFNVTKSITCSVVNQTIIIVCLSCKCHRLVY